MSIQGFSEFLDLFPSKPRIALANGFNVLCPSHNDKIPSLSIRQEGDRILVSCQAGCSTEAVLSTLNLTMADLFLDQTSSITPKIVATYSYQDEEGSELYQVVRYEPKDFKQRHKDGDECNWNLNNTRRDLYHLPEN